MTCKYTGRFARGNILKTILKIILPIWPEYSIYLTFGLAKSYNEGNGDVPFSLFHEYRITGTGYRKNAGNYTGK